MSKKKKLSPPSDAALAARLRARHCLSCDAEREPGRVYCRRCDHRGRERGKAVNARLRPVENVWFADPRFAWPDRSAVIAELERS